MKLILILSLLSGSCLAAATPDLETVARRESGFTRLLVTLPGVSEPTAFVRTQEGTLRLEQMAATYSTALNLSARKGVFRGVRTQAEVATACKDLTPVLELEIADNLPATIEVLANPLSKQTVSKGIPEREGWWANAMTIETPILSVRSEPVLSYTNNSRPLTSAARLKAFEGQLKTAFEQNRQQIEDAGKVKITLNGADDLICDLALKQVRLDLKLITHFEAAYVRKQEVLSAVQIQRLTQELATMVSATGSTTDVVMSRMANLGVLLQKELGPQFSNFIQTRFAKVYGSLIQTGTGQVEQLSPNRAEQLARRLDELSVGKDINQSIISTQAQWNASGW